MIDERYLAEWAVDHPWTRNEYVEQDLVICRAIVDIFSDPFLAERLAWKGGTALHKLYVHPQARYSEDIDLVQLKPEPIKPVFERLGSVLSWLPGKSTQQTRFSNKIKFKYVSEVEPSVPMRLKVEINCVEHHSELGVRTFPFRVENGWFAGACEVPTFHLPELLGTKFNAIYGRKKIRDLFDMDYALRMTDVDPHEIIRCWKSYRSHVGEDLVRWRDFVRNVEAKLQDRDYLLDMAAFLRPGVGFDPREAWTNVKARLVDLLQEHDT